MKTRFNAPFISYIAISMAIYVVLWLLLLLFLLGCFLRSLAVAYTYRMMANSGKFFSCSSNSFKMLCNADLKGQVLLILMILGRRS